MPAIFFGPSARPLYGVLESPGARPRKTGVLLLYPGVQEYMRAHWAFRSLATALAARGYPVLRFDYHGVGDSSGEPEAATFEACVDDACVAAEELREAAGVQHVALIGMRLGAAVALHAAAKLPFVRRVLAWNPIVDGGDYVAELESMDRAMRLRMLHPLRHPTDELAGYRFPVEVRRSIERVDTRDAAAAVASRLEIFAEPDSPDGNALHEALLRAGHTAVLRHAIPDSGGPAAFPDAALLAQGAIAALVARTAESEP